MNSLIDTNVISEFKQKTPNPGVLKWLRQADFHNSYLSVVTICEIRTGIDRLPRGNRREDLEHWLEWDLNLDFRDRVLLVSSAIANVCGSIRARAFKAGRPMDVMDAFLAATAEVNGLTVVTRNVSDFEVWGGPVFNPWTDA